MDNDIKHFVQNCHAYRCSTVPRDKTPGLLHLLLILDHPWQHILMDFKSFLKDSHRFDTITVFVDHLGKRLISVLCHHTIDAPEMAQLYVSHVYRYYRLVTTIVSNHGL